MVINDEQKESLKGIFDTAIANKTYTVSVEALSPSDAPVSVTMPEFMRRMKDMQATGGGGGFNMFGSMPDSYNVTVNGNHKLADKILTASETDGKEGIAKQAFDLALLSQGLLEGKALTDFIKRSTAILGE
jgi:molecular chaperone HtpG